MVAVAAVLAAGTAQGLPPVNLSDVVAGNGGFVANGINAFDFSGHSVSGAGDVNGDGLADVIVGARRANNIAGASYVVFGKAHGTAASLSDVAAGDGGFIITGIDADDNSGFSVSGAGDVNGDGLADVIVGASYADPGGNSEAGESYVVFGKANGTAVDLAEVAAGNGGFVINGIDANDYSGNSVSGAGDVNGDGLADVIVGAFRAAPGGNIAAGESYVVFGKVDGAAVNLADVVAGSGGFVINGKDFADWSGKSVSGAGDVNGDGLADVIVGAPRATAFVYANYEGQSYVVFGKADGVAVDLVDVALGNGGFAINGIDGHDNSGNSVSDAGDVNGDGLADVIVGAYVADPGGNNIAGESYVVFGKADGTAVLLNNVVLGFGGFVINGIDAGDVSGTSVSGAGDVNGDGLADVIVGASQADPGGNSTAGESYVVFGKANGAAVNLTNVAAGNGGFVINGINAMDISGRSVSGAGDVNGDGLADVIVGARYAESGGIFSAGQSYVVFGPAGPRTRDILWRNQSTNQSFVWLLEGTQVIDAGSPGTAGGAWTIAGAGDFNGDRCEDILWRRDNGQTLIWLLNGSNRIGQGSPGAAAPVWQIAGVADFNGDRRADILWRNSVSGQVFIWLIDGTQRTDQGSLGVVSQEWQIAGTGDFDGLASTPTSTADILWRRTNGQTLIWLLDGTQRLGQGSPGAAGQVWQIAGTGDFDGDDHSDIVWRHTVSGQVFIWLIEGTQRTGQGPLGMTGQQWQIVGTGDFDGDRRNDLLWRHQVTGLTFIWLIDGLDRVGGDMVGFAGLDWSVKDTGDFDGR